MFFNICIRNYTEKNFTFIKIIKYLDMKFKLEICSCSVESAVNAQFAGADRVELCSNLYEGGTTPSFGMIASARENLTIGLHVIIRPRGGDFLYSDPEYDIMRRDIELCGENGIDGVVFGILRADGTVDTERTAKLVELAYPMSVTFHRAFDVCIDPQTGLEDIISSGAKRLLTSGQKNTVPEGVTLVHELVKKAGNRIIIMPGGGLNESNIADTAKATGAGEFHLTAARIDESDMIFRRKDIQMGGMSGIPEFSRKVADPGKIKNIINILNMI
jgi:copper homeostasis protein